MPDGGGDDVLHRIASALEAQDSGTAAKGLEGTRLMHASTATPPIRMSRKSVSGMAHPPAEKTWTSIEFLAEHALLAPAAEALVAFGGDILHGRPGPAKALLLRMAETVAMRLADLSGHWSRAFEANEYEVIRPLGEGAFGAVFKAQHVPTGKVKAVKMIKEPGRDPQELARTTKEIKMLEVLHGELNVVALDGHFWWQDSLFLVFDFIASDLGKRLEMSQRRAMMEGRKHGGLPEEEVRMVTRQLVCAMDAVHRLGILHRDLKPENILLTAATVKVADFGVGCLVAEEEAPLVADGHGWQGTIFYAAPEYCFAGLHYGSGVDVWAIGCVVAELITGEVFFGLEGNIPRGVDLQTLQLELLRLATERLGTVPPHLASGHIGGVSLFMGIDLPYRITPLESAAVTPLPTLLPECKADLRGFVQACLTIDPEQRASCAQLLEHPYLTSGGYAAAFEREMVAMLAQDDEMSTVPTPQPGEMADEPAPGSGGGGGGAPGDGPLPGMELLAPDAAQEALKPKHRRAWGRALRVGAAKAKLGELGAKKKEAPPAAPAQ